MSEKIAKLVLMLSSQNPGEVFNAAQAIGRALQTIGKDWHDIAEIVRNLGTAVSMAPTKIVLDENGNLRPADLQIALMLIDEIVGGFMDELSEREAGFIRSQQARLRRYGVGTSMSLKQFNWLDAIYRRVTTV